ncbi:MAG: hypothetical protein L0Y56_02770 [Nitrospira sp.]|nr:hypothetical protein [Nitrospira sp.]
MQLFLIEDAYPEGKRATELRVKVDVLNEDGNLRKIHQLVLEFLEEAYGCRAYTIEKIIDTDKKNEGIEEIHKEGLELYEFSKSTEGYKN